MPPGGGKGYNPPVDRREGSRFAASGALALAIIIITVIIIVVTVIGVMIVVWSRMDWQSLAFGRRRRR
jgi:hypothetical protein